MKIGMVPNDQFRGGNHKHIMSKDFRAFNISSKMGIPDK